jgi:DNA-binding CsgD family transcriptional regulator
MHIEQFRSQVLHMAGTVVPVSRCCFYEVDADCEPNGHVVLGDDKRFIAAYLQQYRACDPFHPRYFAQTRKSVFRTDEGAGSAASRQRYVQGFMAQLGMRYKAEMFLRDEAGAIIAGLRLSRREALGEFEGHDLAALESMQPVIQAAFQHVRSRDRATSTQQALTVREREVLDCMLDGMPNKVIGRRLDLALPTVKSHVRNILHKVGATSRADAIAKLCRSA